jgi:5'-nucleotidase
MEAASLGIPALAISLEAAQRYHLSYSQEVDFSVAAHFTAFFGRILLAKKMPDDVHLLKVDVPSDATPETPWLLTRVAHQGYYEPLAPQRQSWNVAARLGYKENAILDGEDEDSDVVVLRKHHKVAVTPISLDMTSRVDLPELEARLRKRRARLREEKRGTRSVGLLVPLMYVLGLHPENGTRSAGLRNTSMLDLSGAG